MNPYKNIYWGEFFVNIEIVGNFEKATIFYLYTNLHKTFFYVYIFAQKSNFYLFIYIYLFNII